jgi:hypothetical protein
VTSVRDSHDGRFRLALVSCLAHEPYEPRGVRTRAVLGELERRCSVDLVAPPQRLRSRERAISSRARLLGGHLVRSVLIDRFEPWSRQRFGNWNPEADGALLIGYPFSPLAFASRHLSSLGIPYVVDIGDPWALTARRPETHALALLRSRRAETRMWSGAAGAVVTTAAQHDALQARFPELPILVRPNGFEIDVSGPAPRSARSDLETLRLVHFGSTYRARIDVRPFLNGLARAGPWRRVEFTQFGQFGADWQRTLRGLAAEVDVRLQHPLPWSEVARRTSEFDAALVIGNVDPSMLPSKVVSYLSLLIPRIAITSDPERDAIGTYLRDKSGWLVLRPGAPDAAELVRRHISRNWTPAELAAPASESWEAVAGEVADFVLAVLRRPELAQPSRAAADATASM